MASTPIADLYARYKTGTKKVVQWLADTASKGRDIASVISLKKGKHDVADSEIIMLSTKQLTRLAEHISNNSNPDSNLPEDTRVVINILEDVIAHRNECAEWYRHKVSVNGDEESLRSRNGHLHFVEVLRNILRILKNLCAKTAAAVVAKTKRKTNGRSKKSRRDDRRSKTTDNDCHDVLQNIFEGLILEEPTESDATVIPRQKDAVITRSQSTPPQQFELEPQEQDADFALFCLLKECHEIRLWIRKLWEEYADGKLSLQIASEVTDSAFLLIQQAVEDFTAKYPLLTAFEQIADHLSLDAEVTGQNMHRFTYNSTSQPSDSASDAPAEELLCMPAFLSLSMLRRITRNQDMSNEEYLDLLMYIEQQHPFTSKINNLMTEFSWRAQAIEAYWRIDGSDVFMSVLLGALFGESLALHAVIDFQLYMDIYVICDGISHLRGVYQAKNEIQGRIRIFEHKQAELSTHQQFSTSTRKSPIREWSKMSMLAGLDKDSVEDVCKPVINKIPGLGTLVTPWFLALPVYSGCVARLLTTRMYYDGLLVADEAGIVIGMATLYHACRQTGLLKKSWKDMDVFIDLMGASKLGLRPSAFNTFESCANQFGLAMGVELAAYSKDRRGKRAHSNRVPLPAEPRLEQRRTKLPDNSVYTVATNKQIALDNTAQQATTATLYDLAADLLNDSRSSIDDDIRARWQKCRKLTPTELLGVLTKTLEADEQHLHFNYHNLFYICADALITMKNNASLSLNMVTGGSPTIIDFVDDVLWEAADAEKMQPGRVRGSTLSIFAHYIHDSFCFTAAGSVLSKQNDSLLKGQRSIDRAKLSCDSPNRNTPTRESLLKALHFARAERTSQDASISVAGSQVVFSPAKELAGADAEYRGELLRTLKELEAKLKAGTLTKEEVDQAFFTVDEIDLKNGNAEMAKILSETQS